MALDTRNKRGSALGIAAPHRAVWPNPDGSVAAADRQQAAYCYPGILAAEPVAILIDNRDGTGAASRNATGTGRDGGASSGSGRAPNV